LSLDMLQLAKIYLLERKPAGEGGKQKYTRRRGRLAKKDSPERAASENRLAGEGG
jgi:hypothetical protein